MKFTLLTLCLISIASAQVQADLNIYFHSFNETITKFEKELIETVIKFYNKKNKIKYKLNYKQTKNFKELFTTLATTKKVNQDLSVSCISVTDERRKTYDFSAIYLPARYAVFSLKNATIAKKWRSKGYKVGYIKNTTDETMVKSIQAEYNIIAIPFTDQKSKQNAVLNGKIDIMFNEMIGNYSDPRFTVLEDFFKENYGYAIMYPKGSQLRNQLKPIIDYYLHTNSYFGLLKKWFGNKVASILFKEIKH